MKRITSHILAFLSIFMSCALAQAQVSIEGKAELDRTAHDFGNILLSDGPVSCSFTIKNSASEDLVIYNVISSCGCTNATWTREPIPRGKQGTIKVTYTNNEGPFPFEKSLTVYLSNVKKPVILKLRGVVSEKKMPLEQVYPVHFGPLAVKSAEIKGGNIQKGISRSGEATVANIGRTPLDISFKDVTEGLNISVEPNPLPAGSTGLLKFTVTPADDSWGHCRYYATPLVGGRQQRIDSSAAPREKKAAGSEALLTDKDRRIENGGSEICIDVYIRDLFSDLPQAQKLSGANPIFENSTFEAGKVRAGQTVRGTFKFTNKGKEDLTIYKLDCDTSRAKYSFPSSPTAPSKSGSIAFELDTAGLPEGEFLVMLTLTTSSPLRPIVNLYVAGFITK